MAKTKTTATKQSVSGFIKSVEDPVKREDSLQLIAIMQEVTGFEPKMWGPTIVGFGSYHYKYESGHEGDMCIVGFSPRKPAFSLYLSAGFDKREELLADLGKHTTAKGCVYFKKISDIKVPVLKKMIVAAVKHNKKMHP
jgi:hypothetical protein